MKKFFKNIVIVLMMIGTFWTPALTKQTAGSHVRITEQPVQYSQISYEAIAGIPYIAKWYQRNCQKEGIHYGWYKEDVYILVSGGKRPTNGYKIILNQIKRLSRGALYITAGVMPPKHQEMAAHTLTYPCLLLKIDDSRIIRLEGSVNELTNNDQ